MFNILSADKTPGNGVMEHICDREKKDGTYKELSKINNWRKKLSNEYPLSLHIDESEWSSVEHYCFASLMKKRNLYEKLVDIDWKNEKVSALKTKFKINSTDYLVGDLKKALSIKFAIPEYTHLLYLTKPATLTTWKRGQPVNTKNDAGGREIKTADICEFTQILMAIRDTIPQEEYESNTQTEEKTTKRKTRKISKQKPTDNCTQEKSEDLAKEIKQATSKRDEDVPNHFEINISSHSDNLKILSKKDFKSSSELNSSYNPANNKSNNTLTIYEKTNIIGTRMEQLAMGCQCFLSPKEEKKLNCVKKIAHLEFDKKVIPFVICRTLPDNTKEYWKLCDMI